jgi:hypothetical protein
LADLFVRLNEGNEIKEKLEIMMNNIIKACLFDEFAVLYNKIPQMEG